ncbi:MAG: AI-2E family transporter [Paracoccaceae bacterium]|jgi:predicted PurR-regulated permease PerM|nr:AI-2E family transporter [Paracoccaceae bacterium]
MQGETGAIIGKALPIGAIVVVFLLGAVALGPFVPALLWAVFVSVALLPLYARAVGRTRRWRGPTTAAFAIGLVVVVLLPMLILLRAILAVLPELAVALVEGGARVGLGLDLPADMPASWVDLWADIRDDLSALRALIGQDLRLLASSVLLEGRLIGHFVLEFLLGLILASLILHHHERLGGIAARMAEKLGGARALDLGARSVLTIRYTVLGILGSAAVQTAVAAFAYWLVGAPHWPLLAFATFLLGLLQVGPVLIWAPLCAWLWADGETGLAIFLGLWGLFAVGLSDNLVKAAVVARGADLPAILVFLGAVGGLLTWGIVGIFLGPVILALCLELTLWWIGEERAATAGDPRAAPDDTI